jgi:hypothetical protein
MPSSPLTEITVADAGTANGNSASEDTAKAKAAKMMRMICDVPTMEMIGHRDRSAHPARHHYW